MLSGNAWNKVTPAQLLPVFRYKQPEKQDFMSVDVGPNKSRVWAFKTREGAMGLLQVLEGTANPQSLTFRYKLVTGLKPADTQPASRPAPAP